MPELPEVEVVKIGLNNTIINKQIVAVKVLCPKIVCSTSNIRLVDQLLVDKFVQILVGAKVKIVKRINKNLIFELRDINSQTFFLHGHLKMTGQFLYFNTSLYEQNKHDAVVIYFDDETVLVYRDIRKFGYLILADSAEVSNMAYEANLDNQFFLEEISQSFQKTSKTIKQTLLDQRPLSGIGNIYADEILFASGILPTSLTKKLSKDDISKIVCNSTLILQDAILKGGSSISDYQHVDGTVGSYQKFHKVYGRKNLPCLNCNEPLKSIKIAGRSTVFCTNCQK
jgi:formamidopyrimidine-DNA glycosylase